MNSREMAFPLPCTWRIHFWFSTFFCILPSSSGRISSWAFAANTCVVTSKWKYKTRKCSRCGRKEKFGQQKVETRIFQHIKQAKRFKCSCFSSSFLTPSGPPGPFWLFSTLLLLAPKSSLAVWLSDHVDFIVCLTSHFFPVFRLLSPPSRAHPFGSCTFFFGFSRYCYCYWYSYCCWRMT